MASQRSLAGHRPSNSASASDSHHLSDIVVNDHPIRSESTSRSSELMSERQVQGRRANNRQMTSRDYRAIGVALRDIARQLEVSR